jgi:hypothetical protein
LLASGKSCEECPVGSAIFFLLEFAPEDQSFAAGLCVLRAFANKRRAAIDPPDILITILANGECGCRGEDGDQLRLNASANLERPVLKPAFRFLVADLHG